MHLIQCKVLCETDFMLWYNVSIIVGYEFMGFFSAKKADIMLLHILALLKIVSQI